jgi:two-component system, NarL family, invasion response regulator UvrY
MIRVAIADEHKIPRWALARTLAAEPDLNVIAEADSVSATLAMLRAHEPDVLILDATLPDHSGFDVLSEIGHLEAGPFVVVLAPFAEPRYIARVLGAGAHAYVCKSDEPQRLLDAIRAVMRGEQVIPPGVEPLPAIDAHPARALTRREQQVMEMLARGMTNREIGDDLGISIKTVDTHRAHTLKKLELRNNAELTRFAVKHGYVTL